MAQLLAMGVNQHQDDSDVRRLHVDFSYFDSVSVATDEAQTK